MAGDPLEARIAACEQAHDGDCLLQLAEFEAAAKAYQTRAHEGGAYAATALSQAVRLQRELGHASEARALADEFRRQFPGHPRISEVAEDVFRLGELVDQPNLIAHWEMYLRDWAALGGVDRAIVAHARLGRLLLDASCPVAGVRGACVEIVHERRPCLPREERPDPEWGPLPHARDYPARFNLRHARDARLVRQAEEHFKRALRLGSGSVRVWGSDPDERVRRRDDLAEALSEATLLLSHADRDAYLSSNFPEGLDFQQPSQYDSLGVACRRKNTAEWSGKRFLGWMEEKGNLLRRMEQVYERARRVASSRGVAHVAALVADAEAELGRSLYTEDGKGCTCHPHPHCGQREEMPWHVARNVSAALEACLTASLDRGIWNVWAASCLADLNPHFPVAMPLGVEFFGLSDDEPSAQTPSKPSEHAASLIRPRQLRPHARRCAGGRLGVLNMSEGSHVAWLFDSRPFSAPAFPPATPSPLFDHQLFLRDLLRPSCGTGTVVVETAGNRIISVNGAKCSAAALTALLPNAHFVEEWARWVVEL